MGVANASFCSCSKKKRRYRFRIRIKINVSQMNFFLPIYLFTTLCLSVFTLSSRGKCFQCGCILKNYRSRRLAAAAFSVKCSANISQEYFHIAILKLSDYHPFDRQPMSITVAINHPHSPCRNSVPPAPDTALFRR